MKRLPESAFRITFGTAVLLIVLTVYSHPLSMAAEVYVPADYSTIQAAIDGANNGDVIVVHQGNYYENINFLGKAITVKSTDPNDPAIVAATIIDGNQVAPVVEFYSGNGDSILNGVTVQNGRANDGGGIYCVDSSPTISNCAIIGNSASDCGGGIYCYYASPSITNCIIMGNLVENSTFSEYFGEGGGGGIFCIEDSSPDITNCIIARNSACKGGGIFCQGIILLSSMGFPFRSGLPSPKITNCTIVENTASVSGGGIGSNVYVWVNPMVELGFPTQAGMFRYLSSPILTSCILWDNSPDQISDKGIKITFSDVQGWYPGLGNISADPLFVDPVAGNYHLQHGSPCIKKACIDAKWELMDIRYLCGDPLTIIEVYAATKLLVAFLRLTDQSNEGIMKRLPELAFRIAFGTVILLIVLTVYSHSLSLAAEVHVPADYPTIHAAIDGANSGDVIVVHQGNYYEHINFLGKAITVKSTDPNDPDIVAATIIDGNQVANVVMFNSGEGSDSILSGVTVQNGRYGNGGGIYCGYDSSPTISNCAIIGNSGGGIYCDTYSSPTISNCAIIGNSAGYGGGGILCNCSSPSITNCIIMGNSTEISTLTEEGGSGGGILCIESSPDITNCIIARNSASKGGGICCQGFLGLTFYYGIYSGLASPKITNCTIFQNTASVSGGGIFSNLDVNVSIHGKLFPTSGGMFKYISAPIVTSCILRENSPDQVSGKRIQITFSDIQGWYPGIGNISADPLFVDPVAGDYHLQPGSPCIKRGKYQSEMGAYGYPVSLQRSSYNYYRSTRAY